MIGITYTDLFLCYNYSMFNFLNFFEKKKKNIWKELKGRKDYITILAPMLDVTDKPFRQIVSESAAPDIFFTEFVSTDGLASKGGKKRLKKMLEFSDYEKKNKNLIVQIFGSNPKKYKEALKEIKKYDFAGIDINMGCPDQKIIKQGAGSDLMRNFDKAKEVFNITKKNSGGLPVSIKTRIGYSQIDWDWIKFVFSIKPDAVSFHLRTKQEMSKADAHWELMGQIRSLRDEISPDTVLFGNGDVLDLETAEKYIKESGIDGILIGRGIFQNPFLFDKKNIDDLEVSKRLDLLLNHMKLYEEEFGETEENLKEFGKRLKNFNLMKKFFKIYVNGFDGAKELRIKLMDAKSSEEIKEIIKDYLK